MSTQIATTPDRPIRTANGVIHASGNLLGVVGLSTLGDVAMLEPVISSVGISKVIIIRCVAMLRAYFVRTPPGCLLVRGV